MASMKKISNLIESKSGKKNSNPLSFNKFWSISSSSRQIYKQEFDTISCRSEPINLYRKLILSTNPMIFEPKSKDKFKRKRVLSIYLAQIEPKVRVRWTACGERTKRLRNDAKWVSNCEWWFGRWQNSGVLNGRMVPFIDRFLF